MNTERLAKYLSEKNNEINRGEFSEIQEVDEPASTIHSRGSGNAVT